MKVEICGTSAVISQLRFHRQLTTTKEYSQFLAIPLINSCFIHYLELSKDYCSNSTLDDDTFILYPGLAEKVIYARV